MYSLPLYISTDVRRETLTVLRVFLQTPVPNPLLPSLTFSQMFVNILQNMVKRKKLRFPHFPTYPFGATDDST